MFNFQFKPKVKVDAMLIATMQVKKHESCKLKMYKDSLGIWTIGWGFNLQANEIPQDVADRLLEYMMADALKVAKDFCGDSWEQMNEARQAVIINMAYNMGRKTLFSLWTLQTGIKERNWNYAAARMQSYEWYKQVGNRGKELVQQMRTGTI